MSELSVEILAPLWEQPTVEQLQSAVQLLGPERAQSALAAFDDPDPRWWEGCPLARAYGTSGRLRMAMMQSGRHLSDGYACAAEILGIPASEIAAVARAFDTNPNGMRDVLRVMLEAEAAKIATPRAVLVETT